MNHWFGDERSMFVIVEPRKPFNKRRMEGYFVLKIGKFGKGYRNGRSRRVAVNRGETRRSSHRFGDLMADSSSRGKEMNESRERVFFSV